MTACRPIAFDAIAPEAWNAVPGQRRTPMQHHAWASAYAETLANGGVDVFVNGPVERPYALAPFARSKMGSGRWTLLGAEDLWESVEVSAVSEEAATDLAPALLSSGRVLRFGHYPSDSRFYAALLQQAEGRGFALARPFPGRAMPRIRLGPDWLQPEQQLSARRRSDLKRMGRIARESGAVTCEVLCPGPESVDALVNEALDVEASNWKGRAGTAMASVQPVAAFYRAYARRAAALGILRIAFLRIDGTAAAMQLAVQCDEAYWLLKIGYVDTYKRCSPGNLLIQHTISVAAREGLKRYEFLGKESDWTRLWTEEARPISNLRFYPLNSSGAAAIVADAAVQVRNRLKAATANPAARAEAAT